MQKIAKDQKGGIIVSKKIQMRKTNRDLEIPTIVVNTFKTQLVREKLMGQLFRYFLFVAFVAYVLATLNTKS